MQLAMQEDVENALRRPLTELEAEWIDPLLNECADLVVAYLHPWQIPTPPPKPITRVVAAMAAAVLSRPASVLPDTKSLTADVYGITFATGSTGLGPYLAPSFQERLKPYKELGGNGMVVMELASERGGGGGVDQPFPAKAERVDLSALQAVTRELGNLADGRG